MENSLITCEINLILTWSNRYFIIDSQSRTNICKNWYKTWCSSTLSTYNLPLVEIKDYNFVTDGRNFFNQPVKNNLITYDNIRKIATGQWDDYTIDCPLDYNYFNNYYKMIAIDLSK